LTRGTEAVSGGDLGYRVPLVSSDEFALLTTEFNRMVARLQETLVSKERLELSEQELKYTVQALQTEISERLRAEEEQARLQASLRRAETLSAMGILVAGVAHQVRNPLFGTSSVLDAMEARLGSREEYRPYVEALRDSISRLSVLMNELMEYGRPPEIERSPGCVAEVISDAAGACRELARRAQVEVEEIVGHDLPAVLMDRTRLSRAVENLVENAIRHSPPGATVTVSACATERQSDAASWVEVRVEDSGPGFKEADLPRVFEPFFTRRPGGTGLGLALVERIVAGHGGTVTAGNRDGGGASIRVQLPAVLRGAERPSGAAA
jgi:signal transduction histidine kinase